MPFVIYVFTISAFALGLAEFVPIGLTDVMAQGLCVGVEQTGAAVTTYALGATFAAPVLSALTASWSRKNVMLTTAVVFTAGSLAAAFAATLPQLLLARFIAGLGHGLFLAAASSTAEYMVGGGGLMASSSRRYCRFWRVRIPWTVVRYERSRTQRAR